MFRKKRLLKPIASLFLIVFAIDAFAIEVPIYSFSINSYTQNTNDYLPSDDKDYLTPILKPEYQSLQLQQFYNHYYASDAKGLSPWSQQMVSSVLPIVKKIELEILEGFDNQNVDASKRHYAENFKEHDSAWLNTIKKNIDLDALDSNEFRDENKAIVIANTFGRALPENAPDFFHPSLPGEGFPFDNLQESAIWVGTPLYVIAVSKDAAWSLVLTPDTYLAWVKSSDIAYASPGFVNKWQSAAQKGLIAITQTGISIVDKQNHFQFTGYIGAVFPLAQFDEDATSMLIPVKNQNNQAVITLGIINKNAASLMPLVASKKNIATIINQLQNRPYGWGGAFFYNDCSQELKSLFTPFGIWLPRNSSQQAKLNASMDLSKNTLDERLAALKEKGHPLMTIIYIGGHVMLYVGNKTTNNGVEAVTYQNVWGLSPANKDKRYVIGQALFLPLLKQYPENAEINSLANSSYFKLIFLDELDTKIASPQDFIRYFSKSDSAGRS